MDISKFVELLSALSSSEKTQRQQAESMYKQAKASEPDSLVLGFLTVLATDSCDEAHRRQSAVLLRQLFTHGPESNFVFPRLTAEHRQQVSAELLRRFEVESNPKLQKKVGEVVTKLAEYLCEGEDSKGWLSHGSSGWPALLPHVFRMANASVNSSVESCETAVRLLRDLLPCLKDEIIASKDQLGQVLQLALEHADLKLRCAVLLLVCDIVTETEKQAWAPLLGTAPVLHQTIRQLAQANMQELLQEALQAFIDVAQTEPDFFKTQLSQSLEPASFFAELAKKRDGADDGLRNLALEWLVTYVEKKPKWLTKYVPSFSALAIESCMTMMLEMDADEAELQAWATRMEDEEGDEDEDEMYHAGEEAIDRIAQAMGMDTIGTALFGFIGRFAAQNEWQAKHAAIAAVRQTVEYVEDSNHMNEMAKLLLQHVEHPMARVRYAALHGIGQLATDQAPQFQEAWHQMVLPALVKMMDDPVDRVAAMAMSAFVSFGEELDDTLMVDYAQGLMQKLVAKLQSTSHRGVREEAITCIAVIAGVIEKDFSQYYDCIMPMLKQFVMNCTGEKENRVRGKAFECMSLLGAAVGKEKFLPDAREAISAMMNTQLAADDVQREYMKEASDRICSCLKKDFAPFLPAMLPGMFKSLKIQEEDNCGENGDDEFITVSTGDGKMVKVRTAKFDELLQSAQLLNTFCSEIEGAFFDWVTPTAEALLPLLSTTDEISMLCDEARAAAFQTWASLIKVAGIGAAERGLPSDLARELLRTFMQRAFVGMEQDTDPDTLADAASGIAECLKNAGPGVLSGDEVLGLVQTLFKFMDQSFQRSKEQGKDKEGNLAAGLPSDLEKDDDEDDADGKEEERCRRYYEETLGAVMQVASVEFLPCLPDCGQRLGSWFLQPEHKVLALHFACDLLEHLKEKSESVWPIFMPEVFRSLTDADADQRTAAAYAVNLASGLPSFTQAAPEAFNRLAQVVGGAAPKKRDEKGKLAMDNAVAALLSLARAKVDQCPPNIPAWQLVVSKLPLRDDEDEARKVHDAVVDLVLEQHVGILGPDHANLGKILSALAEVHRHEPICTKETDSKICTVFRAIPRESLLALASGFTEKQQKKIEKMLTA